MESSACFPIETRHLEVFTDRANRLLSRVQWTPVVDSKGPSQEASPHRFRESTDRRSAPREVSLIRVARQITGDPLLLPEEINHALTVLRQGLRIAMHVSAEYTRSSGLDHLIEQNRRGLLTEAQKTEFRAKYRTASAITVFVLAYYVCWELGGYRTEDLAGVQVDFDGLPELKLPNPVQALECVLFHYVASIEDPQIVRGKLEFLAMTTAYFRAVIDGIKMRESSLLHVEPFATHRYKLADGEFSVEGFAVELAGAEISVEFNRVELDAIVGNRDAKHKARRLATRLLCYDLKNQRNPMRDLGGLPTVRMGYGEPGTGKSMQIAATATLLADYCKNLGLPFLFWPLPDNVVSTFQGGSAERMIQWMQAFRDPARIVYGPIDDAENVFEDRTRQGVSAGVREVIATFLRNTEGAYAIHHGNAAIELYTNLPDQLDRAVLSRIMDRFYIGGAESVEDFLDQDHLWWRRHREIDPRFVGMKDPARYRYLEAQQDLASLSAVYGERLDAPSTSRFAAIHEEVLRVHEPESHAFFAELFVRIKAAFSAFTSRDVRNIQRAVDERVLDFDLPDEWFESPEVFTARDYETKRGMIIELMRANMKGLTFARIRHQEVIRYIENFLRISSQGRERRLAEIQEQMELQREAASRLADTREVGRWSA